MPNTTSEPEPHPLMRAFGNLYMAAEPAFWRLSDRARSLEAMRRLFTLSKSFRPPRFDLAAHPRVCGAEYAALAIMADASDADAQLYLKWFHVYFRRHPYPAALLDPLHRLERWP
jgi:hypothetical protein